MEVQVHWSFIDIFYQPLCGLDKSNLDDHPNTSMGSADRSRDSQFGESSLVVVSEMRP